jgi:multiple sugar transport system ATP-binding protein
VSKDGGLHLKCDDVEVPVPGRLKSALSSDRYTNGLLLGIRPGDVRVSQSDPGGNAFQTRLYVVERLHRKAILSMEKDDLLIKANTSTGFQGKIGDPIWLEFPEDKLYVFDAETALSVS